MALDNESFNKQLYDLLKVRGYNPVPKNSKNQNVDASQLADVIEFQFTKDGENYGKAWASIDDAKNVIIYYDEAQADSPEGSTPGLDYDDSWSGFLKHVKSWAQRKQLSFELLNKDRLNDNMKQREYVKMKENLREGYYSMGKQASYSDAVPTVKIILQHTRQIQEGEQRYRNIAKIFLENTQGERILAPTTRPGIAQVYARHLAEGGVPNDTRWNHIKSICEEYQKMAGFVRATRNGQFNESAQQLVNEGINHYHKLRESLGKLRGHRGYNMYFESWTPALMEDESEENNLNELFVQETMDPRIETAMPILSRLRKHVSEMAEVKSLSGWADDIINEKIDLQLEGDEVEQVDEMYHVDAVSTHEFRQELNGRLAAQKALAKATKKLDAIQKPKSQAAHTKALKDMDKYPAAQFAKTRKGDGKVHTNESVKQLVEYEKFTDENGVTWNDEGDSDKGHTNWGRGQGRYVKKAGDKFTDKSGRRWVRYAKADGSLGVRPLKEVEQIDESGDTDQGQEYLRNYKEKAKKDMAVAGEKLWYLSVTKGPTRDKWALAVQRDKRRKGIQRANARIKDKEAEQIDEIGNTFAGKKAIGSYIKKANSDASVNSVKVDRELGHLATGSPYYPGSTKKLEKAERKVGNRHKGIAQAVDRLTKESSEQDSKEGLLFAVFVSHPKKTDGEQERKVIRITGTDDMRAGGAHAQNHFTQQGYKVHKVWPIIQHASQARRPYWGQSDSDMFPGDGPLGRTFISAPEPKSKLGEEVEAIDEIGQTTKNNYWSKAQTQLLDPSKRRELSPRKIANREAGMERAEQGTAHVVLVHKAHTENLEKTFDALQRFHSGGNQLKVNPPSGKYGPDYMEIHVPRASPTGRNIENVKHTLKYANDKKPVQAVVVHGDTGEIHRISEGVEQIDEIADKTAISYNNKAAYDITDRTFNDRDGQNDRKIRNREKGMALAQAKLGWGKAKVPATSSASFESRLNEISDTPLLDMEDYSEKKKELQYLLKQPEASNPEVKKQIQSRLGRLEQQKAELMTGDREAYSMNEGMGEADMIVQDLISGEQDAYSILSNPTSQEEKYVSQLLQKEFDDLVIDTGLNPDDDLEEILNLAVDQLAKKYKHGEIDDSDSDERYAKMADDMGLISGTGAELDEVDMGQADRTLRSNPSGDDGKMSQSMGLNKAAHQMGYDHYLEVPDDEISKLHALSKKIRNGEVDEDLDANQKRAGQLGPTEKIGPKGAVGKLVGANESVEHDPLDDIKRLLGK